MRPYRPGTDWIPFPGLANRDGPGPHRSYGIVYCDLLQCAGVHRARRRSTPGTIDGLQKPRTHLCPTDHQQRSTDRPAPSRQDSTESNCTPPTATCYTSSSPPTPTCAPMSGAARWKAGSGSRQRRPRPWPRPSEHLPARLRASRRTIQRTRPDHLLRRHRQGTHRYPYLTSLSTRPLGGRREARPRQTPGRDHDPSVLLAVPIDRCHTASRARCVPCPPGGVPWW